jgi:hypothetical protein
MERKIIYPKLKDLLVVFYFIFCLRDYSIVMWVGGNMLLDIKDATIVIRKEGK